LYSGYAITIAAGLGDKEMVQLLVENGADVNTVSGDEGHTALAEAIGGGHYQVVAYLLDLGVNPNQTPSGLSLLAGAAQLGRPDLVELLLQHGADPNSQSHLSIFDETRRAQQETQQAYDEVFRLLTEAGSL
jgi:ankyrin repeat protein